MKTCTDATHCVFVQWRGLGFATGLAEERLWTAPAGLSPYGWFGTLIDNKVNGTGTLYRRNRYVDPMTGRFTQEDPIGLAGGINLYGYAGSNPVAYTDPFGLLADVDFAGDKERQAYQASKNAIATCALLCGARQAAAAQDGLAALNAAENDHSVKVVVNFGAVPGHPGSPAGNGPGRAGVRGVFVNTSHETMGVNYQVNATVAHEVYESYGLLKNGNPRAEGPIFDAWHGAAIANAEDPALVGAGLPSRTSRTVPGTDRPIPFW